MKAKLRGESESLSPKLEVWVNVLLYVQDTVMRAYYHQKMASLGVAVMPASEREKESDRR